MARRKIQNNGIFPRREGVLVEDHVFTGRDKVCLACDTPNAAQASHCTSCGCGLDEAKQVSVRSDQSAEDGESFQDDTAKAARTDFKAQKMQISLKGHLNPLKKVAPKAENSLFLVQLLQSSRRHY